MRNDASHNSEKAVWRWHHCKWRSKKNATHPPTMKQLGTSNPAYVFWAHFDVCSFSNWMAMHSKQISDIHCFKYLRGTHVDTVLGNEGFKRGKRRIFLTCHCISESAAPGSHGREACNVNNYSSPLKIVFLLNWDDVFSQRIRHNFMIGISWICAKWEHDSTTHKRLLCLWWALIWAPAVDPAWFLGNPDPCPIACYDAHIHPATWNKPQQPNAETAFCISSFSTSPTDGVPRGQW